MAALTQDQLLAVVDRVIDDGYLNPLKDTGPGYELYQASAAVMARCSQAVDNFETDVYIMSSRGGALATVPATLYRTTDAAGAGIVLAGSVVRASGGQPFRINENAVFGASDLEVTVQAIAMGFGYEWNIKGPFIDPDGNTWPGELNTVEMLLQDPVFWDPSIRVRNDADADGAGRPKTLDVLGAERTLSRQPDEGDANYRNRIRTLPDTVSPAAFRRQLTNYFRRFPSITYRAFETFRQDYQECYDAPELIMTTVVTGGDTYDPNLFVYDDPRPASPFRNRWLGEIDYLGAFIVEISPPPPMDDYGFVYDDPAGDEVGLPVSAAVRALSAYDLPDTFVRPVRPPAYDGTDVGLSKFLKDLLSLLDDIKAAGVYGVVVIAE
jgi:hypothetical protein